MKHARALLAMTAAAALAACATLATPYQADLPNQRIPGGYSEERLSEDRYRLAFSAVPSTPRPAMQRTFINRAAEVTLEHGFEWFAVENEAFETGVYVITLPDGAYRIRYAGGYRAWRSYWRLFRHQLGPGGVRGDPLWFHRQRPSASRRIEYRGDIRMGLGSPPDPASSLDARQVLEGSAAEPGRGQ